jgi:hypothetical protein
MINRENYEIYFIDYFEGNLNFDAQNMLFAFLDANEDLRKEFESFENITIDFDDAPVDFDKSKLKKQLAINVENEDNYFIGQVENELSPEQEFELSIYLNDNPDKRKRLKTFQLTKIEADNSIIYPNKSKLKKSRLIPIFGTNQILKYAAAIALLFGLLSILNQFFKTEVKNYEARNNQIQSVQLPIYANQNLYTKHNQSINLENAQHSNKSSQFNDLISPSSVPSEPSEFEPILAMRGNLDISIPIELNVIPKQHSEKLTYTDIAEDIPTSDTQANQGFDYKDKTMSPKEFIAYQFNKKILKKDQPEETVEIGELWASASPLINKVKPQFIMANQESVDNTKVTSFKIGKNFEFTRSKSK